MTEGQAASLNQARYTAKIDHRLSNNDSLNGSFLYDNGDSNAVGRWRLDLWPGSSQPRAGHECRHHLGAHFQSDGVEPGTYFLYSPHCKLPRLCGAK